MACVVSTDLQIFPEKSIQKSIIRYNSGGLGPLGSNREKISPKAVARDLIFTTLKYFIYVLKN
jgi:hypothetical protein